MRRRWISASRAAASSRSSRHCRRTGPVFDAAGSLVCGGFVETHIHLDKSNIIDRCAPESGRQANSMQRVAAVKHTFSVEDVYERASRTLEKCIKHGATRMRTHLELDGGVEMRSFEAIEALRRDYAWAIDVEVCVFPQEGLTNNPRSDALLVEGLKRGAQGDRRGAELRSGPRRAGPPHVRPGARVRCGYRHASRFRQFAGRDGHPPGVRADREIRARRARGGRPYVQAVHHADRRSSRAGAADRRCRRGGDRAAGDRAVHDGPRPGIQRAPRRGGREPAGRARRELLAVHQQRAEPVHAVRRRVAAADGESAGQCLPDRPGAPAARVLRHADRAVGAADEPDGLRHQRSAIPRISWCWTRRRPSRRWRRSAIRWRCSSAATAR